ncbi:MAG: universal stress protein [Bacteroidales bacterium]|jgi:nucleotide-binding universal stress UspA family protein|nr:universal stress protein [Bacteroidales bacterium]
MEEGQKNNLIVVTWDFTDLSEYALAHAVRIARVMRYKIELLHIVKQGVNEATIKESHSQMQNICNKILMETGIACTAVIKEGSLYSTISEYANGTDTQLVAMGTHGIKGLQKLFGSRALKVITGSRAPFIVVQSEPDTTAHISNVVFPIDFKSENKEKVQWAIYIGRNFLSKIFLFKYPVSDSELQKKVNINLNFAIRFLKQNNIAYEIHTAEKTNNFAGETIRFAEKIRADMIIVSTTKDITKIDYVFGADEQAIIANSAKIPVLCMNPRAGYAGVAQFLYG